MPRKNLTPDNHKEILEQYNLGKPLNKIIQSWRINDTILSDIVGEEVERPVCINYPSCPNTSYTWAGGECQKCYNKRRYIEAKQKLKTA